MQRAAIRSRRLKKLKKTYTQGFTERKEYRQADDWKEVQHGRERCLPKMKGGKDGGRKIQVGGSNDVTHDI